MKVRIASLVGKWKEILLLLALFMVHTLTIALVWNFSRQPSYIPALFVLALTLIVLAIYVAYRLGLWKKKADGSFLEATAYVVLGTIVLFGVKLIGGQLIVWEGSGIPENQALLQNGHLPPLLLGVLIVGIAPFVEELLFRGLLMGRIFGKDSLSGLLVSSVLFGLVHGPTTPASWFLYGGMGLVLGLAYRLSGCYSCSVLIHLINNLFGFLMILLLQMLMQ